MTGRIGDLLRLREHIGAVAAVDQALPDLARVLRERSLGHAIGDQHEIDGCLRRRERRDPARLAAADEANAPGAPHPETPRLVERGGRVRASR